MKYLRFFFLLLLLQSCWQHCAIAQKKEDKVTSSSPIRWEPIKDADMLWKKRVWREIEVYERSNKPLRCDQANALAAVLLSGIWSGAIKAYADGDTAFTMPLAHEALDSLIQCDAAGLSRPARQYLNYLSKHPGDSTIADTSFISLCSCPQQVEFFEIKEDWIFDRNKGLMVVRINAIAPAAYVHGEKKPLYWLHYPDIRSYIDKYEVYNGSNKMGLSWDEYFESRQFASRITHLQGGRSEEVPKHYNRRKNKIGGDSLKQDVWVY